jgi:hypothetical protein
MHSWESRESSNVLTTETILEWSLHEKKIKKMLTFYFQSDQFGVNLFKKNIFGKKKWHKIVEYLGFRIRVIVFNATFNNISDISWRSVFFCVEETGIPGENHRPTTSHWQTLSRNVVPSTLRHQRDSNSQLQWWSPLTA